jgi:hypothetical protein
MKPYDVDGKFPTDSGGIKMSKSTLTLVTSVFVFLAFAALGSSAEAVTPRPMVISQMQIPITGDTSYSPITAPSCAQIVTVTGTLNIVTVVAEVKPPNPNTVTVLVNLAGLTATGSSLAFEGFGRVQLNPTPMSPSLDLTANFSLVPTTVLPPGTPPSPCIGMAAEFPVQISLTFDEDGNLTGATAVPQLIE